MLLTSSKNHKLWVWKVEINLNLDFKNASTKASHYEKSALIAQNTFSYVDKVSKAILNNEERNQKSGVVLDDWKATL